MNDVSRKTRYGVCDDAGAFSVYHASSAWHAMTIHAAPLSDGRLVEISSATQELLAEMDISTWEVYRYHCPKDEQRQWHYTSAANLEEALGLKIAELEQAKQEAPAVPAGAVYAAAEPLPGYEGAERPAAAGGASE